MNPNFPNIEVKTAMIQTQAWVSLVKQGYKTIEVRASMIDVFPVAWAVMVKPS